MKLYSTIKHSLILLSLLGCVISIYLVISNIIYAGFCPMFMSIPACYLTLVAYTLLSFSEFMEKRVGYLFFSFGFLLGIFLAIWFSYHQILDMVQCPTIFNVPLCYLSFILLVVIMISKILSYFFPKRKKSKSNKK